MEGFAEAQDLVEAPADRAADVALQLKTIPSLERRDRSAPRLLWKAFRARRLLVSYLTRSLCGRSRSMEANREARFRALIADERWPVTRFAFETELCFLVTKPER